jgi:selenocysteine lyase/cysteine desulfurase
MAVPTSLASVAERVFYLAGGYKYAMAGEGACFLHAPPGWLPRPRNTGWFAAFGDLSGPQSGVPFARDGMRFMGATFDPSALYRFLHVRRMLVSEGLTTATISAHVLRLQQMLVEALAETTLGSAELLNPVTTQGQRARFLAVRHPSAAAWQAALMERDVITDVRGDVLRIGLGIYHDEEDVARFAQEARALS